MGDLCRLDSGVRIDLELGVVSVAGQVVGAINGIERLIATYYDDDLTASPTGSYLIGQSGDDTIHGRDGNDTLRGEEGVDFLDGGGGNDLVMGDAGVPNRYGDGDTLLGGSGDDTLAWISTHRNSPKFGTG